TSSWANARWRVSQSEPGRFAWQVRHASLLDRVFQLSPCGVSGLSPEWHFEQLRRSCGKPISEKSNSVSLKPQILYSSPPRPASNLLFSSRPAWILWTIVISVTGWPLLASVVPGLWHITQNCVSTRPPPCSDIRSWQPLHDDESTILRVCAGSVTGIELPAASIVKSKFGLTRICSPAAFR